MNTHVSTSEESQRDGCVVIDEVLDPKHIDAFSQDLDKNFDAIDPCSGQYSYDQNTKSFGGLFTKSTIYQKMAINQTILDIADAFLLPQGKTHYQINLTPAISIGPSEKARSSIKTTLFSLSSPGFRAHAQLDVGRGRLHRRK